jgi:hypothetical protein
MNDPVSEEDAPGGIEIPADQTAAAPEVPALTGKPQARRTAAARTRASASTKSKPDQGEPLGPARPPVALKTRRKADPPSFPSTQGMSSSRRPRVWPD